jgi:ribonuclease P/MRP protein subunit RPP1
LTLLFCLFLVGFKNVAIEQYHKHETISSKSGGDPIPQPVKLDELLEKTNRKLNLYHRLTIIYSDVSVSHVIGRSQNFKKYHVIAALPTTEAALQHACQTFQGDIITYNSDTIRIRLNRKFYYLAIRRNMFFELKYSPAIIDSNDRRATISRAQQYHMTGKSKGIIISSEATDRFHIRSPYDISGLGLIFGLSEEQAKCAISTMCRKVLIAAESRRLGRTPVLMKYDDVNTSTSEDEGDDSEMEVDATSSPNSNKKRRETSTENGNKSKKLRTT